MSRAAASLALAIASAPISASAGPLFEVPAGEQVLDLDPASQDAPVVAAGGAGHLVLWRSSSFDPDAPSYSEIRGARVLPDGKLYSADTHGIFFGFSDTFSLNLRGFDVAAGGPGYLAAWEHRGQIHASWVSASSVPPASVASESVLLAETTATMLSPAVAFDSATMSYLVVWVEADAVATLRGARVSVIGGAPIPGQSFTIAELPPGPSSSVNALRLAVACGAASCLVAFSTFNTSQVYGVKIAPGDAVTAPFLISTAPGSPDLPASGSNTDPALAFDGASYVAVWMRSESGFSVHGSRVSEGGEVLDPGGVEIVASGFLPSIAARSGQPALVTWRTPPSFGMPGDTLMAARVDTAGALTLLDLGVTLNTPNTILSPELCDVALAGPSVQGLAVWSSAPWGVAGNADIWATVVKESAGALAATLVSTPLSLNWNAQTRPAITSLGPGAGSFLVWKDTRGAPFLQEGEQRLATAFFPSLVEEKSSPDLFPNIGRDPSALFIAAGADSILAAWLDHDLMTGVTTVEAGLVEKEGAPILTKPLYVASAPSNAVFSSARVSGAFDGSAYVLVWSTSSRVRAARVSGAGVVLQDDVLIFDGGEADPSDLGISSAASAYGGGGDFVVVWQSFDGISYKRISTASDAIEVPAEAPTKLTGSSSDGAAPYVAVGHGGGDSYLIVWIRVDGFTSTLFGTRVSKSGERLDSGFTIESGEGAWSNPVVVFDGKSYLVLWQDQGVSRGAWVSPGGVVFKPTELVIAEPPGLIGPVSASSAGEGFTWVAFSRSHFADPSQDGLRFDVDRVRVGVVKNPCAEITCPQEDECSARGVCNPALEEVDLEDPNDRCVFSGVLPDGTPCNRGLCIDGACIQDPPGLAGSGSGGGGGGEGGSGGAPEGEGGGCACEVVGAARGRGGVMAVAALAVLVARRLGGRRRRR